MLCFSIVNAEMLYVIDNQPNLEPTASIVESGPWYTVPTYPNNICIKPSYLPTCDEHPNSWLMSFSTNSFNPAAGRACYLQATCNLEQTMITIAAYSEATCTTSPRIIGTALADSYTITHLIRFGISVIANCE